MAFKPTKGRGNTKRLRSRWMGKEEKITQNHKRMIQQERDGEKAKERGGDIIRREVGERSRREEMERTKDDGEGVLSTVGAETSGVGVGFGLLLGSWPSCGEEQRVL